MNRHIPALAIAFTLASATGLRAQEPAPAPAPAPAAAAQDSVDFSGDWEWGAQTNDTTMGGVWRINRQPDGRYTGVVTRTGGRPTSPAPIRSFNTRGRRGFSMTVDFDGVIYTFQGQLEGNAGRSINGTMNFRGGMGRLRAEKRSQ